MKRFQHRLTLPSILTLLVLAIAGILVGFLNYERGTSLPSNANTSAIGVELDQNLADIDLHELQDHDISFVYLNATQGRSYFDDRYLFYRDQILGTKLAYGTIVRVSDESTPTEQVAFLKKKVGRQTGSLPILLIPAVNERKVKYLRIIAKVAQQLENKGKRVMVALDFDRYHHYFDRRTRFLAQGPRQPDQTKYVFWLYTNEGHVKNVSGLAKNVVMFAYNGTVQEYKQNYGQLTQ